jgi:hypothetical protein
MNAAAVAAMSTAFARFDNLLMLALFRIDWCSLKILYEISDRPFCR